LLIYVTGGLKNLNLVDLLDIPLYITLTISLVGCFVYFFFKGFEFTKNPKNSFLVSLGAFSIIFPIFWGIVYIWSNFSHVESDELTFFVFISVSMLTIYSIVIRPWIDKTRYRYVNQNARIFHDEPFKENDKIKQFIRLEFVNKIRDIDKIYFDIFLETYNAQVEYSLVKWFPKEKLEIEPFTDRYSFKWNNIKRKTKIAIKILAEWSKDNDFSKSIKIKPEKCNIELGNRENISVKLF